MLSIIIPARNEEEHLPLCLESIRLSARQAGISPEVIVVLNRCTDRTEEIACSYGCIVVSDDRKNLSCIRNTGARTASGEALITIDADSQMRADMLPKICRLLENPKIIGGGTFIVPDRFSPGIICTFSILIPIALLYGISGGLFFCRRDAFAAVNGFDESFVSVEDIDFARRLRAYARQHNKKFYNLFTTYITTSTRKFDRFGDWFFLKNPKLLRQLFGGKNAAAANKVWYDFER
jgi:glycosyltransferase involved in cell wall biosynthesis